MGKKLTGEARPAAAACGDSVIEMSPDESVLILIKHCRDMKQQETRLRLATLLLLLSCMALILFNTIDPRRERNSAPSEQGGAAAQSPVYSKQETVCPGDPPNSPTTSERPRIHLRSVRTNDDNDQQYLKWDVLFETNFNKEKPAFVIPQTGIYFVYVRIDLSYTCEQRDEKLMNFSAELHTWNENYNKTLTVMSMWDSVHYSSEGPGRTVFDGQLFDLVEGTHMDVWIHKGYGLIRKATLGAYLT